MLRRRRAVPPKQAAVGDRNATTVASRRRPAAITPAAAVAALLAARLASALLNIVHDCDEVFNYWEPLHNLLYGWGLQTWEYSAAYALRSYLYLLLHAALAAPALLLGPAKGKLAAFYLVKAALGVASAATEALLYRAVWRRYQPAVSHAFLGLLVFGAGMFAASTALLPSSFAMYAMTAAAAALLESRPQMVILAAVVGVIWGWFVAGLAFLPYALYVLLAMPLLPAVGTALLCLLGTLSPLVLADRYFYARWTASLWNFVKYNVVGGGESALYGVEGPMFYLRNGANNLHLALPLALLLPALALVAPRGALAPSPKPGSKGGAAGSSRGAALQLLAAVSPVYVWLAAITALPHKEERFLYVVYPLVCLAAASSLAVLLSWTQRLLAVAGGARLGRGAARAALAAVLVGSALLGVSRSAALVRHYGAPMQLYRHLPPVEGTFNGSSTISGSGGSGSGSSMDGGGSGGPISVCVGAEWHRYPSSFFLPGPRYRLQFIKSGFSGLLPRPFDPEQGGTAAAPPQLNDRNREEPANYWASPAACDYLVTLREEGGETLDALGSGAWTTVASVPFVEHGRSPPAARAFYLPGRWAARNHWVQYVLLRQQR